jgi:hypothetical protein
MDSSFDARPERAGIPPTRVLTIYAPLVLNTNKVNNKNELIT